MPFFPRSKRLVSIIQMPDAFRAIHHRGHLFQLIISIRTALDNNPTRRTALLFGSALIYSKSASHPSSIKRSIPTLEQHLEQVRVKGSPLNRQGVAVVPRKEPPATFPTIYGKSSPRHDAPRPQPQQKGKRKTIYTSAQRLYARHPDVSANNAFRHRQSPRGVLRNETRFPKSALNSIRCHDQHPSAAFPREPRRPSGMSFPSP